MRQLIDRLVWRWVWWREARYQRRLARHIRRRNRDWQATKAYYDENDNERR